MAKEVKLTQEIDENGILHVQPSGTEGRECLDLMDFLSRIPGFTVVETVENDNFKEKKVQTTSHQKVG